MGKVKLKFNPIDSVGKHKNSGFASFSENQRKATPNLTTPYSSFQSGKYSKGNTRNKCFSPDENVSEEHEVRPNLQPDRTAVRTEGIP